MCSLSYYTVVDLNVMVRISRSEVISLKTVSFYEDISCLELNVVYIY